MKKHKRYSSWYQSSWHWSSYWHDWSWLYSFSYSALDIPQYEIDFYWSYHYDAVKREASKIGIYLYPWRHIAQDLFIYLWKAKIPRVKNADEHKGRIRQHIEEFHNIIKKIEKSLQIIRKETILNTHRTAKVVASIITEIEKSGGISNISSTRLISAMYNALNQAIQEEEQLRKEIGSLLSSGIGDESAFLKFIEDELTRKILQNNIPLKAIEQITQAMKLFDIPSIPIYRRSELSFLPSYADIHMSDELPPLPIEIIKDEILPDYLTKQFLEKTLLTYQRENEKELPNLIFVCDRSGSMDDKLREVRIPKIVMMKAIFFILFKYLFRSGKRAVFIAFDTEAWTLLDTNTKDQLSEQILDILTLRADGGTDITNALLSSYEIWKEMKNAEVVVITDGELNIDEEQFSDKKEFITNLTICIISDKSLDHIEISRTILSNAKKIITDWKMLYEELKTVFIEQTRR